LSSAALFGLSGFRLVGEEHHKIADSLHLPEERIRFAMSEIVSSTLTYFVDKILDVFWIDLQIIPDRI